MITIQLQRQGVSRTVHGHFAPCPHGHAWYVELQDFQSRAWSCHVSYPSCAECFGPKTPRPKWDHLTVESYEAWKAADAAWHAQFHNGQIAWSNWPRRMLSWTELDKAKIDTLAAIGKLLKQPCQFDPEIEHYCYDGDECTRRNYPHTVTDIYITCATYDREADAIRHEPSGDILIQFTGPTERLYCADTVKYWTEIDKAYKDFLADHNQRAGEFHAKARLAWLLGEYIKELPGEHPVRLREIVRGTHEETHQEVIQS